MERYSHYVILWKDIDVKYARIPAPANPHLYTMKWNDWIKYSTQRLLDILSHFTFVKVYLFFNFSLVLHDFYLPHLVLWKNRYYLSTFNFCSNIFFLTFLIFAEDYVLSSTFYICGRIHDVLPHFYFLEVY